MITPTPGLVAGMAGGFALGAGTAGYGAYKLVTNANDGDHPVRGSLLAGAGLFAGAGAASFAALKFINPEAGALGAIGLATVSGALGASMIGSLAAGKQGLKDHWVLGACPPDQT